MRVAGSSSESLSVPPAGCSFLSIPRILSIPDQNVPDGGLSHLRQAADPRRRPMRRESCKRVHGRLGTVPLWDSRECSRVNTQKSCGWQPPLETQHLAGRPGLAASAWFRSAKRRDCPDSDSFRPFLDRARPRQMVRYAPAASLIGPGHRASPRFHPKVLQNFCNTPSGRRPSRPEISIFETSTHSAGRRVQQLGTCSG